jgi:ubiquinone/menaquinone biosynthesis C-methylase UbiE
MRTPQEATVGLFSRAAPTYNAVGPRHFTYFAQRLVEYVDVQSGDRVLDVATGTGAVLLAAAPQCGDRGKVVGVDLTTAMLARAAAAIQDQHVQNADLYQMDAEDLIFPDGSFDVALSAFGLSSVPNRMRALAECWRILRPGGRLGLIDGTGWYFQDDARWHWLEDVLRAFGALRDGDQADLHAADLAAALTSMDFAAVRAAEDAFELVFRDEEEWWGWLWSHGTRRLLEAVPPTRQDELKQALFQGLPGCYDGDGMIHGTMRATLVCAHKPQAT